MFNRTIIYVLVAALAAGLGLWAAQRHFSPAPAAQAGPATRAVRLFEPTRELPPFSLRQSDGTALVPGELKGHWTLVFLGFTHCPDVCPLTLTKLTRVIGGLGGDARDVRVLLVSTDPARDTPAAMADYVARFGPQVTGLTGDSATLAAVRAAYGVYAGPHPADADHGMTHTASVWGIDRQGLVRVLLPMELPDEDVAADVRELAALE